MTSRPVPYSYGRNVASAAIIAVGIVMVLVGFVSVVTT